jgi:hypothetical protein
LDGPGYLLDFIEQVAYVLDPSFPSSERVSKNRETNFAIDVWPYGEFPLFAKVLLKDGGIQGVSHEVTLNLPPDDKEYIQVED